MAQKRRGLRLWRGFDQDNGCEAIMEGFRVHYNLVKNHQTLGITLGVAVGLESIDGFRWIEILKDATGDISPEKI